MGSNPAQRSHADELHLSMPQTQIPVSAMRFGSRVSVAALPTGANLNLTKERKPLDAVVVGAQSGSVESCVGRKGGTGTF
jgi:hypothetical protein